MPQRRRFAQPRGREATDPGRGDRRAVAADRGERGRPRQRAVGVRRLWRHRARTRLGRFQGLDLRGKIVVVLINDPDFEGGEGEFGGKAMTYYGRWTYKYEEAARRGAAGVLIVHETAPASYGWATVKNSNTNTMFDIVRANPAAEHTPFDSWIQRDLATRIFAASGLDFEAAKPAAKRKDFQPIAAQGDADAPAVNAKTERIVSQNVVGRSPARSGPTRA